MVTYPESEEGKAAQYLYWLNLLDLILHMGISFPKSKGLTQSWKPQVVAMNTPLLA